MLNTRDGDDDGNHQGPGLFRREITGPVDNEFLGSGIGIALMELRRIEDVEELSIGATA